MRIALMTEAAVTSETSVNFYQTTRRNISQDNHLYPYEKLFFDFWNSESVSASGLV
jgi:hypothetical protein